MSVTTVDPPFTCLADGPVTLSFSGVYFLRRKGDGGSDIEMLHFYFLRETATSVNSTNPGVARQGQYRQSQTDNTKFTIGNPFAIWLHDKNATTLQPLTTAETVELNVTFADSSCRDSLTLVSSGWTDVADVMQIVFAQNSTLRKTPMQECTRFTVTFPQFDLTQHVVPELFSVQPNGPQPHPVALPSTRAVPGLPLCQHSTYGELVLFPRPRFVRIDPPFVCEEAATVLVLTGDYMMQHQRTAADASSKPNVASDSLFSVPSDQITLLGCSDVVVDRYSVVQRCNTTELAFNSSLVGLADTNHTWAAFNNPSPATCGAPLADRQLFFYIAPRPKMTTSTWPFLCAGRSAVLQIDGSGFVRADGRVPQITYAGSAVSESLTQWRNCVNLTHDSPPHTLDSCTSFNVTLTPAALVLPQTNRTDVLQLVLPFQERTVPACASTFTVGVIKPMELVSVVPADGRCNLLPLQSVYLVGEFWEIDGVAPAVLRNSSAVSTVAVQSASCTQASVLLGRSLRWCSALLVTGSGADDFRGLHSWSVSSPLVSCGVVSVITTVSLEPMVLQSVLPRGDCSAPGVTSVALNGTFWVVDGIVPPVTVDGSQTAEFTETCDAAQVFSTPAISTWSVTLQRCQTLLINQTGVSDLINSHSWTVGTNPACNIAAQTVATAARLVPVITGVTPNKFCFDQGGTIFLTGTNFGSNSPFPMVWLVDANGINADVAGTVTASSPTSATVVWSADTVAPGTYRVRLRSNLGCQSTTPASDPALTIVVYPLVLPFAVIPSLVTTQLSVTVSVYVAGLTATPKLIELFHATIKSTPNITYVPGNITAVSANEYRIRLPKNMFAGAYNVHIVSQQDCFAFSQSLLRVTADTSLTVTSMSPAFVKSSTPLATTVTGAGFLDLPQAYLTLSGSSAATGVPVKAIAFVSSTQLRVSVDGLSEGVYDLLVINPDGKTGIKTGALTVLPYEPLRIDSTVPVRLESGSGAKQLQLLGVGFAGAFASHSGTVQCKKPLDVSATSYTFTPSAGTNGNTTLTIGFTASLDFGQVCVVNVVNTVDGTSAQFASVPVGNPARKLDQFYLSVNKPSVGRRGAAVVMNQATSNERYLFIISGETGGVAAAMGTGVQTSVEQSLVSPFGVLGTFQVPSGGRQGVLPSTGRSFASSASVGPYIYVAGGHTGSALNATVLRALVLSPTEVPSVSLSLDVRVNNASVTNPSIPPGIWTYQVAAIYDSASAVNPGGEMLPSEPFSVTVPVIRSEISLRLVISWTAVPGAAGYNIYRGPAANAALSQLRLHTVVMGQASVSFTDGGSASTATSNAAQSVLPRGSIGNWATVATLQSARAFGGQQVASFQQGSKKSLASPTNSVTHHLLFVGGHPASNHVDRLVITRTIPANREHPETQTVLQSAETNLPAARAFSSVMVADEDNTRLYGSGQYKVLVFAGVAAAGVYEDLHPETNTDTASTSPLTWTTVVRGGGQVPTQAACRILTGNNIYSFCGAQPGAFAPVGTNANSEWLSCADSSQPCSPNTGAPFSLLMPTNSQSNAPGVAATPTAQAFGGCAYSSSTFFMVGGVDSTGATTADVQFVPI